MATQQYMFVKASILAVGLVFCGSSAALATSITLFNTGVNSSGSPLTDGTLGDPHYTLQSVPAGSTSTIRVRTSAGGYPVTPGTYIGDDGLSNWIGPNNDSALDGQVGNYDYRTTFDLTGFNLASVSITGGWSTDNVGTEIVLNGTNTGAATTAFNQFATGFAPFSITSGFVPGINTLDFIVNNAGGPTALRVEMTGSGNLTSAVAAPEPATLTLLGLGLTAMCSRRRRQRRP